MAKVCMLVFNSVFRDARVIKEAASLAKEAYDITVLGISDDNNKVGTYILDNNIKIKLIEFPNLSVWKWYYLAVFLTFLFLASIAVIWFYSGAHNEVNSLYIYLFIFISGFFVLQIIVLLADLFLQRKGKASKLQKYFFSRIKNVIRQMVIVHTVKSNLRKISYDVLHCHDLFPLKIGAHLKGAAKLIWDAHEIYEEIPDIKNTDRESRSRVISSCAHKVDRFITINHSISGFYRRKYKQLPDARIIKNATIVSSAGDYDYRLHDRAELPHNQKILLYHGGFALHRGLTQLVTASEYLDGSWTLVMMGWGKNEQQLKKISEAVILNTNKTRAVPAVVFLPPVPQKELDSWSAGGTIGAIPYENTGLNHLYCTPNKLWEYPNAGVPVICSPLVEMKKVIEEYRIGWLLPEDLEPLGIANTINNLTDEDINLAKSACLNFIEHDNWGKYEKELLALYQEIT